MFKYWCCFIFNLIMLIVYHFFIVFLFIVLFLFSYVLSYLLYFIYCIIFYLGIICRIFVSIFIGYWAQGPFLLALNFDPNGPRWGPGHRPSSGKPVARRKISPGLLASFPYFRVSRLLSRWSFFFPAKSTSLLCCPCFPHVKAIPLADCPRPLLPSCTSRPATHVLSW